MAVDTQAEPVARHGGGPQELPPPSRALDHLKSKLKAKQSAGAGIETIRKLLRKALEAYKADDYAGCCELALKALELGPDHPQANHVMAVALERLGELSKAVSFYERALELDPSDSEIYYNLGLVAWRLKMFPAAERLFRLYIARVPGKAEGYNNLGGILRDEGRYDDAIDVLRGALYRMPEEPQLWNSLGTVVMETGSFAECQTFFDEAIRLKPDYGRAFHNLGYLFNHIGPYERALEFYDQALALALAPEDRAECEHARALCLVQLGQLAEGFSQWHVRTEFRFRAAPVYGFRLPLWSDEPLAGKKILLVAEQGLGDEIMFANAVPDIVAEVGDSGRALIACAPRLVPLFARSFPRAIVGPYQDSKHNGRLLRMVPWLDRAGRVDHWAPFGSLLRYRRARIEDFAGRPPLFSADPMRVAHWRGRLAEIGQGPHVGISWKSLVMAGKRAKLYTPIQHWAPVLQTAGVTFINLQYGDCAADIEEAQSRFGVTIHNFADLDIKNNLDDNAALCAALDLVISSPNAAAQIAGSVGTEVWFIAISEIWPQLGTDHLPWYPKTRVFAPKVFGDFADGLGQAAEALSRRVASTGIGERRAVG
jgi:tetratricopeptide (TPR) repeat protein